MTRYMAHSPSGENSEWQTLKVHAEGVTIRVEHHLRYLSQNMPELLRHAKLIGYLHDLGKYRRGESARPPQDELKAAWGFQNRQPYERHHKKPRTREAT